MRTLESWNSRIRSKLDVWAIRSGNMKPESVRSVDNLIRVIRDSRDRQTATASPSFLSLALSDDKNSANIDRRRSDSFGTLARTTNCGNAGQLPLAGGPPPPFPARLARPFRWSIFAGSGIRLRERQSFPAFLRKRRNLVEAARSTMDPREWFSNRCTTAPLYRNRFALLPCFGFHANLFAPVENVVSNSGMYTNSSPAS